MNTQHTALEATAARVNAMFGEGVDDLAFAGLVDAALAAIDAREVVAIA